MIKVGAYFRRPPKISAYFQLDCGLDCGMQIGAPYMVADWWFLNGLWRDTVVRPSNYRFSLFRREKSHGPAVSYAHCYLRTTGAVERHTFARPLAQSCTIQGFAPARFTPPEAMCRLSKALLANSASEFDETNGRTDHEPGASARTDQHRHAAPGPSDGPTGMAWNTDSTS